MGTIKIGSPKYKKGISVNPDKVLFNEKNVKSIISGSTIIWLYGAKLIPVMSSNSMDGITITASSTYSSVKPYYAFDGKSSTYWHTTSNAKNNYLQVAFSSRKTVNKISLSIKASSATTSRTFVLQASNGGSTWIDLKSINVPSSGGDFVEFINNKESYANYRLYCNEALWVSGSYTFAITEMQLYGY